MTVTVDVHTTDTTWRIHLDDEMIVEVPRTVSRPLALAYTIFRIDLPPAPIYLDNVAVLSAALTYPTRLVKKDETMAGALPYARRIAQIRSGQRRAPT